VLVIDLFQFNSFISDVLKNNLLKDSPEMYIQSIKLQIEEKIREVFYRNQDFSVSLESDKYIVFCVVSKTDGEVEIYEEVYAKCIQFLESIKEIGIEASVGIGRVGSDLKSLHNAYYTAWEALRIGKKLNKTPKIYYINHYIIEELFSYVHQEFSENYINHTLKELKQLSNFDEMFQTIIVWCETNFSVVKAAKQLNIHRNTLLYRLEKLSELTGKDLKDFKSAVSLYLAIKLDILNS
ncbi:MAG: helix-turn-helix domain-containing protein, partial [Kurthia sp.]|nr:helix-turn-helix domain-containing protein [Candidatus Kurthia equi]